MSCSARGVPSGGQKGSYRTLPALVFTASARGPRLDSRRIAELAAAARQASVDGQTGLVGMAEAATTTRRQIRAANVPADVATDLEQAVVDIERAIDEDGA